MDLGDKKHRIHVFDSIGTVVKQGTIDNTREAVDLISRKYPQSTVTIETETHSPWINRRLKEHGRKFEGKTI